MPQPDIIEAARSEDSTSGIGALVEPTPLGSGLDAATASTSSYASYASMSSGDGDGDSAYYAGGSSPSLGDSTSLHPSLGSAIYKHSYERGRRYHYFRNGKYPIPNDEREQDREDLKHTLVLELTDGRLILAPVHSPQRIIDLGTGTGIWAMEVGDKYPGAHVVGIDLSPIQPVWVPPNVKFIIDDVEDEWIASAAADGAGSAPFDYAHLRMILQFVDPVNVLGRVFNNLQRGGWVETGDFDGDVHCDDGTMPPDWPVKVYWDRLAEAMPRSTDEHAEHADDAAGQRDMKVARRTGVLLEQAGFVNVSATVYKVPIGTWPADKTMRLIGMYMRQVMLEFLEAAALKAFRALGMADDEIASFLATVHAAIQDCHARGVHSYTKYCIWTAQKPE